VRGDFTVCLQRRSRSPSSLLSSRLRRSFARSLARVLLFGNPRLGAIAARAPTRRERLPALTNDRRRFDLYCLPSRSRLRNCRNRGKRATMTPPPPPRARRPSHTPGIAGDNGRRGCRAENSGMFRFQSGNSSAVGPIKSITRESLLGRMKRSRFGPDATRLAFRRSSRRLRSTAGIAYAKRKLITRSVSSSSNPGGVAGGRLCRLRGRLITRGADF